MVCKHILLIIFLNKLQLIFYTQFQVLLFNTNNSVNYYSFVYTLLNGFKDY